MMNRRVYTVEGILNGDSNDEEFPLMTLCDECVEYYHRVDSEQNLKPAPYCDRCGL